MFDEDYRKEIGHWKNLPQADLMNFRVEFVQGGIF